MRPINLAAQLQREKRQGTKKVLLMYIQPRDRDNPTIIHGVGFWKGEDTQNIIVPDLFTGGAASRTFYHHSILGNPSVRDEVGLNIKTVTVDLSSINAAVNLALRGYDPNGAKVQMWHQSFDPHTHKPLGIEPFFKGEVDGYPIKRPAPGGEGTVSLRVVSTARQLTFTSPLKKSHEAMKARSPTDTFREWKSEVGKWDVPWGQK
jgi:hypothetical protein